MKAARAGITLVEVLIAIFIMAIGLLALLTLFPLGALSMAEAIRHDRNAQAADQADACANMFDVRNDANVQTAFATSSANLTGWDGPGYPVFADPWGKRIGTPATVGNLNSVLRTDLAFTLNSRPNTMRWCALQDELTFLPDGTPDVSAGLQRDPRTTWGFWLKRPNNAVKNVVDMSVVVYSGRDLQIPSPETAAVNVGYNAADPTFVALDASAARPDVRRGMWVLDLTTHDTVKDTANARKYGPVHGFWYRVVDANDTGINGADALQLELQPKPQVPIAQLVIMEGVSEVFPKGTGWK
jgi:hypothetical protein